MAYIYDKEAVVLKKSEYVASKGLAVMMDTLKGEPYAVITKAIPPYTALLEKDEAFIDTNNLDHIEMFLIGNGIAEYTGQSVKSGYCSYPLYRFDMTKLEEDG